MDGAALVVLAGAAIAVAENRAARLRRKRILINQISTRKLKYLKSIAKLENVRAGKQALESKGTEPF